MSALMAAVRFAPNHKSRTVSGCRTNIDVVFVSCGDIDRELQEIAENLHRNELTALERDTQIGRWAELTASKGVQVAHPFAGGKQPHEKGESKVARELGLDRTDVVRAVKVAFATRGSPLRGHHLS